MLYSYNVLKSHFVYVPTDFMNYNHYEMNVVYNLKTKLIILKHTRNNLNVNTLDRKRRYIRTHT